MYSRTASAHCISLHPQVIIAIMAKFRPLSLSISSTAAATAVVTAGGKARRLSRKQAFKNPAAAETAPSQADQQPHWQHDTPDYSFLLPRQAIAMFAAGAALGPFCDGLHSQHNVLHYTNPTVQLSILHWSLETCWWVPLLFGVAGLILGVSVPVLDELAAGQRQGAGSTSSKSSSSSSSSSSKSINSSSGVRMGLQPASWSWVLLCISLFVCQYGLSGMLEQPLLEKTLLGPVPALDAVLCCYALLHYAAFDATPQGLAMSALTAVCGPVVEVLLINLGGLYHYTHPVWASAVPTWIPWVYFCGGPAVGNLGRIVWQTLKQRQGR